MRQLVCLALITVFLVACSSKTENSNQFTSQQSQGRGDKIGNRSALGGDADAGDEGDLDCLGIPGGPNQPDECGGCDPDTSNDDDDKNGCGECDPDHYGDGDDDDDEVPNCADVHEGCDDNGPDENDGGTGDGIPDDCQCDFCDITINDDNDEFPDCGDPCLDDTDNDSDGDGICGVVNECGSDADCIDGSDCTDDKCKAGTCENEDNTSCDPVSYECELDSDCTDPWDGDNLEADCYVTECIDHSCVAQPNGLSCDYVQPECLSNADCDLGSLTCSEGICGIGGVCIEVPLNPLPEECT